MPAKDQSTKTSENVTVVVSRDTIIKYTRKYPRLFSKFKMDELFRAFQIQHSEDRYAEIDKAVLLPKTLDIILRSDIFISKFIEDCYDAAYAVCNTTVSTDRWRKQNGLDLNGYDAFPLIVERFLAQTYSMLDVKQQKLIEIIVTIEHILSLNDRYKYSGLSNEVLAAAEALNNQENLTNSTATSKTIKLKDTKGLITTNKNTTIKPKMTYYDSQKLLLFTQFLTEESDSDTVALFLSKRELIQNILTIRLKDLHAIRIWAPNNNNNSDISNRNNQESNTKHTKTKQRMLSHTSNKHNILSSTMHNNSFGSSTLEDNSTVNLSATIGATATKNMKKSKSTVLSSSTQSVDDNNGSVQRTKIVPLKLPSQWHYIQDITMPETPILAFESSYLAHILFVCLPKSTLEQRKYIAQKVVEHTSSSAYKTDSDVGSSVAGNDWTKALINLRVNTHSKQYNFAAKIASVGGEETLNTDNTNDNSSSNLNSTTDNSNNINNTNKTCVNLKIVPYIPVYALFAVLLNEHKAVPLTVKLDMLEGNKLEESLTALNHYYENDREITKATEKNITDTEAEINILQTRMIGCEKTIRRLTRRWNDNLAKEEELDQLQQETVVLNNMKLSLLESESKLTRFRKLQKAQQNEINELWHKATTNDNAIAMMNQASKNSGVNSVNTGKTIKPRKKHVTVAHWVTTINSLFLKVLDINMAEMQKNKEKNSLHNIANALNNNSSNNSNDISHNISHNSSFINGDNKSVTDYFADPSQLHTIDIDNNASVKQDVTTATGALTVTSHLFIIEIMSKITVNNAVREGLRRVKLAKYLEKQEEKLLLQYGSAEYLASARAKQAQIALQQKQLARYNAMVKHIQQITPNMVSNVINCSVELAAVKLFDSWSFLDDDPTTWLTKYVLDRVNYLFTVQKQSYYMKQLYCVFKLLSREYKIKRMQQRRNQKMCFIVLQTFIKHLKDMKNIATIATKLQHIVKHFLSRVRCNKYLSHQQQCNTIAVKHNNNKYTIKCRDYLSYWHKHAHLSKLYKQCVFNRKDRRFIITFYIWLDQYKKHKINRLQNNKISIAAAIVVQKLIRCFIAKCRVNKMRARLILKRVIRTYNARQKAYKLLLYRRRLIDLCEYTTIRQQYYRQKLMIKLWRKSCHKLLVMTKFVRLCSKTKCKRGYGHWKKLYEKKKNKIILNTILIQSVMRMVLCKRFILNYYRFSRGLKIAQALWRRQKCIRKYNVDIYYYRIAKRIQRVYRGHYARCRLTAQRIKDIHYASSNNKYERLRYYIEKYPELVVELDYEGNTALHNAAKTASKRTLKELLRFKMNPNALNVQGFSALHLCIMSPAVNRDECFTYMIEHGFSEDQLTPTGQTALLLAVIWGRMTIVQELLSDGLDTNTADYSGLTCLQSACQQGNYLMAKELIDHEADMNACGANGSYPLHDVTLSDNIELAYLLFHHGAYINVYDTYYQQTPLMWACQSLHPNSETFVRLYISQGALVNARDYMNRTAAHYAATGNSVGIFNALREGDCEFDAIDNEKDTPLHLAAEYGSENYATSLLYSGVYCSGQNSAGNQPAHIAAKYNQLELLKHISLYDEHIGRVNYAHQTPLGVAKLHNSQECREFLETHYRLVENRDTRNVVTGELWWDRAIDELAGDWEVIVNAQAERVYRNIRTGEISDRPPAVDLGAVTSTAQTAELPLKRNIVLVKEENKLNKHAYYAEYAEKERDVAELMKDFNNATIITKYARRKLAYLLVIRLKLARKHKRAINIFMKRHLPGYRRWRLELKNEKSIHIQALFRGYICRKKYFTPPSWDYNFDLPPENLEIYSSNGSVSNSVNVSTNVSGSNSRVNSSVGRKRSQIINNRQQIEKQNKLNKQKQYQNSMYLSRNNSYNSYGSTSSVGSNNTFKLSLTQSYGTPAVVLYTQTRPYDSSQYYEVQESQPCCGKYYVLRRAQAHRRLRYNLWDLWVRYKRSEDLRALLLANSLPVTLADWQTVLTKTGKPLRSVGMYDEFAYPNTRNILFYRHRTTGSCYLQKPAKMAYLDDIEESERQQIKKYGATLGQIKLVIKLQSLYRGYHVRVYSLFVERAMNISVNAEQKYLSNPEVDSALYNYGLFCLVTLQDLDRARRIYVESLRRMQYRGPDIPFVLYSYAIFAMISHDEDYLDILNIIARAKKAEVERDIFIKKKTGEPPPRSIADGTYAYGRVFELAKIGFFRHAAVTKRNAFGWENFAICHFLVYNDFNASFDAFMEALKYEPLNKKLQSNFDIMMTHFHGKDKKKHDKVVKHRLRYHATQASDREEMRRKYRENVLLRNKSAKMIQKWYANRKGLRVFNAFMNSVRKSLADKTKETNNSRVSKRVNIRE